MRAMWLQHDAKCIRYNTNPCSHPPKQQQQLRVMVLVLQFVPIDTQKNRYKLTVTAWAIWQNYPDVNNYTWPISSSLSLSARQLVIKCFTGSDVCYNFFFCCENSNKIVHNVKAPILDTSRDIILADI